MAAEVATVEAVSPTPLAVDAARICREILPDIGLRTWRRMDSAGKVPRGMRVGGKKLWAVEDLRLWVELGCPDRETFERARADRG